LKPFTIFAGTVVGVVVTFVVVVGIKDEDSVVEGSVFDDTVVVGIKVEDSVVEGSVVAGATVVEESGSGLIEVTLLRGAAPFEGKAAPVVAGRAEFFKRVVSGLDDPSEAPQAESTTNTVTRKNLFMLETYSALVPSSSRSSLPVWLEPRFVS
jgi:hypothetical protein